MYHQHTLWSPLLDLRSRFDPTVPDGSIPSPADETFSMMSAAVMSACICTWVLVQLTKFLDSGATMKFNLIFFWYAANRQY
jgi:hypothetical protein